MKSSIRDVFFSSNPCLVQHVEMCMTNETEYLQELKHVCDKGVVSTLSQPTKAMILATLHMTGHSKLLDGFLSHCDVVAVVKACQILDRPRLIKQLEQKIAAIELAHPALQQEEETPKKDEVKTSRRKGKFQKNRKHQRDAMEEENADQPKKKRKRKIDVYRAELKFAKSLLYGSRGSQDLERINQKHASAVKEIIGSASLSGAFAKKVRHWANKQKADILEFVVMSGSLNLCGKSWRIGCILLQATLPCPTFCRLHTAESCQPTP